MEGLKEMLISFFEENKNKGVLLSKDEIINLDNKINMSEYTHTSDTLKKKYPETSIDDIIIGFKEGIFFTKSHFYIIKQKGLGSDIQRFEIEDFSKIGGKPKGLFTFGKVLVDNTKIKLVRTSKNDMFELFELLKPKISLLIKENQ